MVYDGPVVRSITRLAEALDQGSSPLWNKGDLMVAVVSIAFRVFDIKLCRRSGGGVVVGGSKFANDEG